MILTYITKWTGDLWLDLGWTAIPFVILFLALMCWAVLLWRAPVSAPVMAYLFAALIPFLFDIFAVAVNWTEALRILASSGIFDTRALLYRSGDIAQILSVGTAQTIAFITNGVLLLHRQKES